MTPPLVVVLGPTMSGKSGLAVELAKQFSGEVLSCDSVQVYKGFNIGTAKLTPLQQQQIPHHLIDIVEPAQLFTAGDYARIGREVLADVSQRRQLPIIAGGTGLYLRALLEGLFEGPKRSEALRLELTELASLKGVEYLHGTLMEVDPGSAQRISPQDQAKLIRALEVFYLTAKPLSQHWLKGRDPLQGYRVLKLGLNPPRQQLYQAIDLRVEQMFNEGLVEEVQSLLAKTGSSTANAFQSLGYSQTIRYLQGELDLVEAISLTQQGTRHYAKRQMTWFRKEKNVHWLEGFGFDAAIQALAFQEVASLLKKENRH
ncbi:MAG: tRNA (adenosine(37)-N6)-dimethylallyltransferase MiaA [Terriglobia bacterium]